MTTRFDDQEEEGRHLMNICRQAVKFFVPVLMMMMRKRRRSRIMMVMMTMTVMMIM